MWNILAPRISPPLLPPLFILFLLATLLLAILFQGGIRSWVQKWKTWQKYCASHSAFSVEAGQGKHRLLEDPWSSSRNYWLCHHAAIKHVFSRAAIPFTDHRAGFDWFHYAGWEVPTTDPTHKATVRVADQTVHGALARSKLKTLLATVQAIGYAEIDRIKDAVGPDGRVVALHTQLYRLGYNVNCIGIFGPQLDHWRTRVALQGFTERQHELFHSFNWPLPLWLSARLSPGARATVKARKQLYRLMLRWYESGGMASASEELQAVSRVFEHARAGADVNAKFMNMMMIAFLANTPETLGWLFTHLVQSPVLFSTVRAECDALLPTTLAETNFKQATPHLYSAFFETFRLYVFTGTPATVIRACTLPGIGDHVFHPGDILHSMGAACALDEEVYGVDARVWRGGRFVGSGKGEELLKYDLTFGIGRSPCPGRNFAIAELCMLAARLIQVFDFSEPGVGRRLRFDEADWSVGECCVRVGEVEIVDLDGAVRRIVHPGNGSDSGPPGMTAANVPMNDFLCKLTPRRRTAVSS